LAENGGTRGGGLRSFDREEKMMDLEARKRHKRVTAAVFGVILIGLGALYLLQNFGIVYAGDIGSWWPLVLIGFGVASLIAPKDAGDSAGGAVITGIGTFFLLRKLDVITWRFHDAWPVFLVIAGVALVLRSLGDRRRAPSPAPGSLEDGSAR
jgi:Domain of unknown function (DUF5668)